MRKKTKCSFIENETTRKSTFKKRKKGMMKKLTELVTLCDVKACAVVFNPYDLSPEVWPSKEGVEEVVSKFMELPVEEQTKKMMNQEDFIHQRIVKEKEQLQKLCDENRDIEIRNVMFNCIEGKMDVHQIDEKNLRDLSHGIDMYLNKLYHRKEILTGESSSSSSLYPPVAADTAAHIGLYDHMIQNQQNSVQFRYEALYDFYNQIPQKIHAFNMNFNSKQRMLLDLNQNLNAGEDEDILSMDNI